MKIVALLIATAIAVGISLFSARNPEIIQIDLLVGKISVALSLAIIGSAFLGMVAGGIIVVLLKSDGNKNMIRKKSK